MTGWTKKITTMTGANMFWPRYGWEVYEHGRSQYKAVLSDKAPMCPEWDSREIIADSLSDLMLMVGDRMMKPLPGMPPVKTSNSKDV